MSPVTPTLTLTLVYGNTYTFFLSKGNLFCEKFIASLRFPLCLYGSTQYDKNDNSLFIDYVFFKQIQIQ